jgi:hypothetical protein
LVTETKKAPSFSEEQPLIPATRHPSAVWLAPLFLLVMLLLKGGTAFWLYRLGYLEYDGDGFTRSVHAWEWLERPRFEIDAWLPLQFWLNGGLMAIFPDLFYVPRVVNMLASCVTVVCFFFIGRWLFSRSVGYGSAAAVAVFPWEIWFGMSGMAESLTHMFLSLGIMFFAGWLRFERTDFLVLASVGFLGATTLRYEAWFYSAVYVLIVLVLVIRRSTKGAKKSFWQFLVAKPTGNKPSILTIVFILSIAFWFALIWMAVSWVQKGSPFAFVSITSAINANLESKNNQYNFFERLIFYPRIFYELMPRLVIPAIVATVLLILKPTKIVTAYLILVWGEFGLFILSTLPFNNIAPGSARYPVSNLMLLLPVVVWLFGFIYSLRPQKLVQGAVVGVFLLLLASFIQTTFTRDLSFPDGDTRQLVLRINELTEKGDLPKNVVIPAHFPNPLSQNGADYSRIWAIETLTNRPQMKVISEIDGFDTHIRDEKSLAWLHIKSAGDAEAIQNFANRYRHNEQFGNYLLSYGPLNRPLEVSPKTGDSKQLFVFSGVDFEPNEKVSVWISLSANDVRTLQPIFADANGRVQVEIMPPIGASGAMSLTARGEKSARTAVAEIVVS